MPAKYYDAIKWIAANDDPETLDKDSIESYLSVTLIADLFGKTVSRVATDVQRCRTYNSGEYAQESIPSQFRLS